ncbi:hypothetical protein PR048_029703 [Dryococelus australis]|uniref:Uncharacterized protein n=1 Tax=Dryococelus australis TaxID=614101 RepID=A0ABQ9GE54_9NEOP|nr:hypothetical protein PR048_029703 [Dryococelus australis]
MKSLLQNIGFVTTGNWSIPQPSMFGTDVEYCTTHRPPTLVACSPTSLLLAPAGIGRCFGLSVRHSGVSQGPRRQMLSLKSAQKARLGRLYLCCDWLCVFSRLQCGRALSLSHLDRAELSWGEVREDNRPVLAGTDCSRRGMRGGVDIQNFIEETDWPPASSLTASSKQWHRRAVASLAGWTLRHSGSCSAAGCIREDRRNKNMHYVQRGASWDWFMSVCGGVLYDRALASTNSSQHSPTTCRDDIRQPAPCNVLAQPIRHKAGSQRLANPIWNEDSPVERGGKHNAPPPPGPTESLPDFRTWESCRTMPLVGGFSQGSPVVSPALSFRRCSMLTSLHPHWFSCQNLCTQDVLSEGLCQVPSFVLASSFPSAFLVSTLSPPPPVCPLPSLVGDATKSTAVRLRWGAPSGGRVCFVVDIAICVSIQIHENNADVDLHTSLPRGATLASNGEYID